MISACILTFNEEKNLQAAIDNIREGVDEIIIVDNFSTDLTQAIATANQVKIIEHHTNNDFGTTRNIGIEAAKGDWIFMLDADERCTPALVAQLQQLAASPEFDGYSFPWQNYADDRFVETLFKTVLFKRYGHYIHELHEKVQGLKSVKKIEDPELAIIHRKSVTVQKEHLARYKKIIEDNLAKYRQLGDAAKIAYYEEHLEKQRRKEALWAANNVT